MHQSLQHVVDAQCVRQLLPRRLPHGCPQFSDVNLKCAASSLPFPRPDVPSHPQRTRPSPPRRRSPNTRRWASSRPFLPGCRRVSPGTGPPRGPLRFRNQLQGVKGLKTTLELGRGGPTGPSVPHACDAQAAPGWFCGLSPTTPSGRLHGTVKPKQLGSFPRTRKAHELLFSFEKLTIIFVFTERAWLACKVLQHAPLA